MGGWLHLSTLRPRGVRPRRALASKGAACVHVRSGSRIEHSREQVLPTYLPSLEGRSPFPAGPRGWTPRGRPLEQNEQCHGSMQLTWEVGWASIFPWCPRMRAPSHSGPRAPRGHPFGHGPEPLPGARTPRSCDRGVPASAARLEAGACMHGAPSVYADQPRALACARAHVGFNHHRNLRVNQPRVMSPWRRSPPPRWAWRAR